MNNPFAGTQPQEAGWAQGFAIGFKGLPASFRPPEDMDPAAFEAFNRGQLVGRRVAVQGLPFKPVCVYLNAKPPSALDLAMPVLDAGFVLKDVLEGAVAGAVSGGILLFIDLAVSLETFFDDPQERLTAKAAELQQQLTELGIGDSTQLFVGGGVDKGVVGCELKMTPVFPSLNSARSAVKAMGRPQWLVVSWRTDASGGVQVADFSV